MSISGRLSRFGTTVFARMSHLASQHHAINLSQGFPDFQGPEEIVDAVVRALRAGHNQYAPSRGVPKLREVVAGVQSQVHGLDYDPATEVLITSGATEGIAASILGLVEPGDEVILFEPYYDSYPACVALAGGAPKFVTLRFPDFGLDVSALEAAFSDRTKLVVINTPHNPCGKVWRPEELAAVAKLAIRHDALVLSDEVYEHLVFDGRQHVSIASLPDMRSRTIRLSSAGKSYAFTGFKVGWAMGPPPLIDAVQAAHQFLTYATPTPLQIGLADGISTLPSSYYADLGRTYQDKRDFLVEVLADVGLQAAIPEGTYFILARFDFDGNDVDFAEDLTKRVGVAAIPPSFFYSNAMEEGQSLVRFSFCKQDSTLAAAAERLRAAL